MGKRFVVVGSATAVAGLVLGASIVFGPAVSRSIAPHLPDGINAPSIQNPTDNPDSVGVQIQAFDYTTFEVGSDGQLRGMRLRATRTNLKPQGVTELIKPNAEIRLGPQRAITITADKADMVMEDGKPRQGQFTGNVVVTLAQAPDNIELILDQDDPKHLTFIQQRIYLDHATDFSIEDDTIYTQGPVHATSSQVDFFGIGLRLAYNTQRERIEQLIINEGRYLIINPNAEAPGFSTTSDSTPADPTQAKNTTDPAPTKQFYAATFRDNILVRDGLESELAGQSLTIDFTLGTDAIDVQPLSPETQGQLPRFLPTGQLAQSDESSALIPALNIPQPNRDRALLRHEPERDIVVTWTGPLVVTPHSTRPDPLTSDDDAHLALQGPNAYAQTTRNGQRERLEAEKLEYLLSSEQTTAYASEEQPLNILSDAMGGSITGQKLIVRQAQGSATILGPGSLTTTDKEDGKTLTLSWQDRLDLELYTQQPDATDSPDPDLVNPGNDSRSSRSQTKILGVKTATFAGRVTATHTDFDLRSDQLTLGFAKPDKTNDIDNHPTEINAAGSVAITARGDAEDEVFDITAGHLTIDLKLDTDRQPFASAIRAVDDVTIQRPGSELACNRVSVDLIAPSQARSDPTAAGISDSTRARFAQVRTILAVGKVRAKLDYDDRRIDLLAGQLLANVQQDKLTLASESDSQPAEIIDLTTGRKLTGQLVEMDDQAEQLTITGAGSLATILDDPNNPNATIEDAFLAINWSKSMAFNNITGQAEFNQDVRSESRRSTDSSEMTCEQLTMQFSPDYKHDPARLIDDDGQQQHERQIRWANATGNVKFLASAWNPEQPNQINNRIRLEGPELLITNQPATTVGQQPIETLVVNGEGKMVLEDYRKPDTQPDNKKADITGRGATLFAWSQRMTLNARDNTADFRGNVQMTHLPKDEQGKPGDPIQLDCQNLLADMTDTGGLSVWLSDTAPDARIQSIVATDNVRLLQQGNRSMRGDRLTFNAQNNTVTLDASDNRDVILEDLERDTATRTNKITWDLTTDRIEIDQLRGGVAPLN